MMRTLVNSISYFKNLLILFSIVTMWKLVT